MSRTTVYLAVLCLAVAPSLIAQNIHPTPSPDARAVPLREEIHLDGKLDEPVWHTAPPATDFRQSQPHEGQPATQRTEVQFAFDGAALYVGARMFEDSGARGVRTMLARRDADFSSDYLQVIFDTYHDHIGRLFFLVNPSGVKQDANGLGGGGDPSWDPVWEVKTNIDSLGWTAEMRIPFSQLRFPSTTAEQTWGLQIWRQDNRLNELSQWSFWGLQETGGPPRFGHLHGLVITSAPGRAELLPYIVGRNANIPGDSKDPFYDPHAFDGRTGIDARVLLTSNLTLATTVNPDFGQVEVDPAVVNLTDVETRRVVFAQLLQNSIGMDTRVNVTFSPTLTLELFMQPLIASGKYSRWREFATSRTTRKLTYGVAIGTVIPTAQGDTIDPDGAAGPAQPFFIARRDFTFRSLRGNTVLRWEYRPGSTLFVVWTRSSRIPDRPEGDIRGGDFGDLFQGPSENVFLVKVNYWLGF
ncbi:MAG TPA: carbohydrate binding family 9 domain-containing protein [Gemmatimonadales bacterium]|nr:carbohydrate binding family 9 domain-containing protein [Gemmatimonadales bacterium]